MLRCILLSLACVLLLTGNASAAAVQDALEVQKETLELDQLEQAAKDYTDGTGISLEKGWEENLSALVETGTDQLFGVVKKAVRSGVLLLVIALLCSLGEGVSIFAGEISVPVIPLAGSLSVAAVAVADVNSLLGMGTQAMEGITSFSNVLLPVVTAVTAATGAITGAAARQMAAVLFSGLLVNLIDRLLVPVLYGYIAASVAYAAVGNEGLKRIASFLKWLVTTVLTVVLMAFVGYLTVSGVMTGSADAATIKAAKFAISGAVPVVGSILADASESVLAAAGILRGTVGVFGMVIILGICLLPFLHLAIHYLAYKLAAALSATVVDGRVCTLIDSLGSAFGLILGMTGACALLMLVALVSSALMVTV